MTDRRGEGGYFNRVASVDALFRPSEADSISINAAFSSSRYSTEMEEELELRHLYSTLNVEGGQLFEANAPQLTAVWQFNTRTFFRAILQYSDIARNQDLYEEDVDELSRDYFVQLLFSYKVNPQTVFFLGYSDGGQENQDISMTATDRSLFLKIGYAWTW